MSLEDWAFSSNASWCERGLERTEKVKRPGFSSYLR